MMLAAMAFSSSHSLSLSHLGFSVFSFSQAQPWPSFCFHSHLSPLAVPLIGVTTTGGHGYPKNRLGSREGADEIKCHPFFRGVNWALVRCTNPPELYAPLFGTTEAEKEAKIVNPELEDLQTNVF